jgi:hypothetical protein
MSVAAVIHVAVVGGAALYARSLPSAPLDAAGAGPWLDLSLVESPERVALPPPTSTEKEAPEQGDGRVAMRVPRRGPVAPNPGESGTEGPGPGAVLDPSGTDPEGIPGGNGNKGTGTGSGGEEGKGTGGRPINLGIDRGMTWLWTQPDRPAPKPRPASTTGGLREALDAHDRKVGLGFGGPVVSAFHAAAASPSAPQNGRARFEAVIDASGRATSVRILSANGDMRSWQVVAEQVLRTLRARLLRVPLDGSGLAIVVDVRSRYQLPSGSKPGKAIEAKGVGAQFDVSDIGATPAHNVAVYVVTERRL